MSNWILIGNTHINLDMIMSFGWSNDEDAGRGYLTLKDLSGGCMSFEDADKALYRKVCSATCQNVADLENTPPCGYCGKMTPGAVSDILCKDCSKCGEEAIVVHE